MPQTGLNKYSGFEAATFSPSKLVTIDQSKFGVEASLRQISCKQTKTSTVKQNDMWIEADNDNEKVTKAPTEKIGLMRYTLLSTVIILAQYNIHLYLSQ